MSAAEPLPCICLLSVSQSNVTVTDLLINELLQQVLFSQSTSTALEKYYITIPAFTMLLKLKKNVKSVKSTFTPVAVLIMSLDY